MKTNLRHVPHFAAPRWCFNGHVHTIARSLRGDTTGAPVERIEIPTPDEDFLELDCAMLPDSRAVIALFHGLEGSTNRYYMIETMKTLLRKNYSVVGVNFRSCGSRMNNRPRFYHSGETGDYTTVFHWVREQHPDKKLGAVGFSLGANALLKFLAEVGSTSPLEAAVAVSVPYDLRLGSLMLSKGFRRVYEQYFLHTLRKKLEIKRQQFSDLPIFSGSTLFAFDDQVTGPLHGFEGAEDYYHQCSSGRFIEQIQTDTLLIHSRQDPLCPIEAMPVAKINTNEFTDYIITDEGGHVGFWSRPKGWLQFVIENYLSSNI